MTAAQRAAHLRLLQALPVRKVENLERTPERVQDNKRRHDATILKWLAKGLTVKEIDARLKCGRVYIRELKERATSPPRRTLDSTQCAAPSRG